MRLPDLAVVADRKFRARYAAMSAFLGAHGYNCCRRGDSDAGIGQ